MHLIRQRIAPFLAFSLAAALAVVAAPGVANGQTDHDNQDLLDVCSDPFATPSASMTGTEGDDIIIGTPGRDIIEGLGGDDILCGMGGDDLILSGPGNDAADGGFGDDKIRGGGGRDLLWGGNGRDKLFGMTGADELDGGQGKDRVNGGPGKDVLFGGPGTDKIVGDDGSDELMGNDGRDRLLAGTGNDLCVFDDMDSFKPCEEFFYDLDDEPVGGVIPPLIGGFYIGHADTEVLIFNGSGATMTIFVAGQTVTIPAGVDTCDGDIAPPFGSVVLPAGTHSVRVSVDSPGVDDGFGTWTTHEGATHFDCYGIV